MTKFKIGDWVTVIHSGMEYSCDEEWIMKYISAYKDKFAYGASYKNGTTGIVVKVAPHEDYNTLMTYGVYTGDNIFIIEENGLEPYKISKKKEEKKMFTKDNLNIGYVVETRNKRLYMVMPTLKDGVVLLNRGIERLGNYNNNLENATSRDFDIVKVYDYPEYVLSGFDISPIGRKLLYERKIEPPQKIPNPKYSNPMTQLQYYNIKEFCNNIMLDCHNIPISISNIPDIDDMTEADAIVVIQTLREMDKEI